MPAVRAAVVIASSLACIWFAASAHAAESPTAFILAQARASQWANAGKPVSARPSRFEEAVPLAAPVSDTISEARRFLGRGNPTGFAEAWCRDFVNMVLQRTGHRLADTSHMAIAAVRLGQRVAQPRPGDIAVMRSHVTFFAGWDGPGTFIGLGGNQHGHRVTESRFPARAVVAWIEPR
jgi:hypothetical protein